MASCSRSPAPSARPASTARAAGLTTPRPSPAASTSRSRNPPMSLSAALQIGTSALNAAQMAIQVTGNNLANAATQGYSRQIAILTPTRANSAGRVTIGTGVGVSDVRRQVDDALQARL